MISENIQFRALEGESDDVHVEASEMQRLYAFVREAQVRINIGGSLKNYIYIHTYIYILLILLYVSS